jgi:hypothetical protein
MQIEIDECVYWILHTVVSSDLLKYNHVTVREEDLEFIVIEAKDYCIDLTGLTKIEKINRNEAVTDEVLQGYLPSLVWKENEASSSITY